MAIRICRPLQSHRQELCVRNARRASRANTRTVAHRSTCRRCEILRGARTASMATHQIAINIVRPDILASTPTVSRSPARLDRTELIRTARTRFVKRRTSATTRIATCQSRTRLVRDANWELIRTATILVQFTVSCCCFIPNRHSNVVWNPCNISLLLDSSVDYGVPPNCHRVKCPTGQYWSGEFQPNCTYTPPRTVIEYCPSGM